MRVNTSIFPRVLCETIKALTVKVGRSWGEASHTTEGSVDTQEDSLSAKCTVLNDKLDLLLRALHEESVASMSSISTTTAEESSVMEEVSVRHARYTEM